MFFLDRERRMKEATRLLERARAFCRAKSGLTKLPIYTTEQIATTATTAMSLKVALDSSSE